MDAVEFGVLARLGHELFMGIGFDDVRSVEDHDEVGHAHRAEAVKDQNGDAAVPGALTSGGGKTFEQGMLGLAVQGRGEIRFAR